MRTTEPGSGETRAKLVTLVLATAVALGSSEVAARLLGLSKTWTSNAASSQLDLSRTTTGDVIGYRRVAGKSWAMPYGTRMQANSVGFTDREFEVGKASGTTRVAILGDSVAEGFGIRDSDRFSAVIARRLQEASPGSFEVLNFAVTGHATVDEYLILRDHALRYSPDVVLLQFGWNDLSRNEAMLPHMEGRPGDSAIPLRGAAHDGPTLKDFLRRHSALYLALAERLNYVSLRLGGSAVLLDEILATPETAWRSTECLFDRLLCLSGEHGFELLVTYLPEAVEVETSDPSRGGVINSRLHDLCRARKVAFLDVLGTLRGDSHHSLFLDDVHMTAEGNLIVGAKLADDLLARFHVLPEGRHGPNWTLTP